MINNGSNNFNYSGIITNTNVNDMQIQVDTITTSQTWNPPNWAKYFKVFLLGGGSGGGSGNRQPTNNHRCGGGGGGGSTYHVQDFTNSQINSPIAILIGSGGSGGTSASSDNSAGNNGIAGGITYFGSLFRTTATSSGSGAIINGQTADSGNSTGLYSAFSTANTFGTNFSGKSTNCTFNQPQFPNNQFLNGGYSGGGGSGNQQNVTTSTQGGGLDAWSYNYPTIPISYGGINGNQGTDGTNHSFGYLLIGTSGGGGSYATAQNTGRGGNGGYGAGGGGGAGSDNGFTSGRGGNGGDGLCIIVSMG
jgi:hypothetical protein